MFRRGQGGQTITWMAATIVIIVLSIAFLFITNDIFRTKSVLGFKIQSTSASDSGTATQQMLFAIMDSEVDGVKVVDLVKQEKYDLARGKIVEVLREFEKEDIRCVFQFFKGKEDSIEVIISGGATGKIVEINFEENALWRLVC